MTTTTTVVECAYSHDDRECFCDLCGQEIVPACAGITIAVGHMESPEGEGGFDVCLDCAGQRAGFIESIAALTAEVTDKWEAKMRPQREFRQAREELKKEYKEAISPQREAFDSKLATLADEYKQATGQEVMDWDRRIDWPL